MKIILITSKPDLCKTKFFFVIIKGLTIDPVFQIKEIKSNKNNLNNLFHLSIYIVTIGLAHRL